MNGFKVYVTKSKDDWINADTEPIYTSTVNKPGPVITVLPPTQWVAGR